MTIATERARTAGLAVLVVAVAASLAMAPGAVAKKKGGGGSVNITKVVNAPILDEPPGSPAPITPLNSTIDVGKQFKGRKIRDVNVTVQTLGTSGPSPGDNLVARLVAPNGANTFLFSELEGFAASLALSLGPLTLDDEALLDLGIGAPDDATRLFSPWNGTAVPDGVGLWVMDNGGVRGTWTLNIYDFDDGETSNLVSWRLNVIAGRPFQTK